MIQLLTGASQNTQGDAVNVRPSPRFGPPYRITATGSFAGSVTVQYSPSAKANDWINITTSLAVGASTDLTAPVERLRASTGAGAGTATVYVTGSQG